MRGVEGGVRGVVIIDVFVPYSGPWYTLSEQQRMWTGRQVRRELKQFFENHSVKYQKAKQGCHKINEDLKRDLIGGWLDSKYNRVQILRWMWSRVHYSCNTFIFLVQKLDWLWGNQVPLYALLLEILNCWSKGCKAHQKYCQQTGEFRHCPIIPPWNMGTQNVREFKLTEDRKPWDKSRANYLGKILSRLV
jgi:hypothetical protein